MAVDPVFVVPLSLLGAFLLGCTGLLTRLGQAYGKVYESVIGTFVGGVAIVAPLLLLTSWPASASPRALGLMVLDGVCGALAVALLYTGIARVGPSISYALKNTSPLTAVALAVLVLREVEPWAVYLGGLLTVLGVALLSIERIDGTLTFRRPVLYPMLGAVFFGLANVARRSAMSEASSPLLGVTVSLSTSLLLCLLWLVLTRRPVRLNRATPYFVAAGAVQGFGLLSVFTAMTSGHVAVVVPLYTSTPVFVLILSPFVLGRLERITPRIVAGVLTVLGGVVLISVSQ